MSCKNCEYNEPKNKCSRPKNKYCPLNNSNFKYIEKIKRFSFDDKDNNVPIKFYSMLKYYCEQFENNIKDLGEICIDKDFIFAINKQLLFFKMIWEKNMTTTNIIMYEDTPNIIRNYTLVGGIYDNSKEVDFTINDSLSETTKILIKNILMELKNYELPEENYELKFINGNFSYN